MKCEKCGANIPSDKLYCENCGEEISIVPLFEPEVETEIDEHLNKISSELMAVNTNAVKTKTVKKKKHYLAMVLILVIISMFAAIAGLIYLNNSPVYHVNQGNRLANSEKYMDAVQCYEKALTKNPENPVDIYMCLMRCYEKLGYEGQYEEYLIRIIESGQKTDEQEIAAYTRLIRLYEQGNSYQTINSLLNKCNNDKIREQFKEFMVGMPVFSHEEGVYNKIVPLKLSSPDGHNIFYTLDGTMPNEKSQLYKETIFLEDGVYEFHAICIDEHGVKGETVSRKYVINFVGR